ncbi:NAD(P)-binding protein [Tothia fuscella]|uniref:NAD(P)-binding protein n=1 Tax=Tothia fuscella TaxID=1048955 RepID=A0A9P4TW01_9PEZI|nr:NAD(P)-binding protein [Tothia fuscella]
MPSYVIIGVSRSLGWEFMNTISSDPNNTVIGLVRDKTATEKKVSEELKGRSNITILEADLTNYNALKKAASETAAIIDGKLDYLIANAALIGQYDAYDVIGDLGADPDELTEQFHLAMNTNVLSNVYLYNLFTPQILEGNVKKVVFFTSGIGDMDWVNKYDLYSSSLYSTTKAAMNMLNAKFTAQYKKDGVLFLSIYPGMVDVGHFDPNSVTPKQQTAVGYLMEKSKDYAPDFKDADSPPDAVKAVLSVVKKSSIDNGDGGAFLSHYGNKQ